MNTTKPISIKELLSGNIQLASPPEIFLKMNEAINNPATTLTEIATIVEHDPGLSARLLKIVNSPYYGFPSRIVSVGHAVGIIGFRDLRDLVIATLIIDKFSNMPSGLVSMRQFWMNCVRRALTAKILATKSNQHRRLEDVFLSALLQDIGLLVVYQKIPELARAAVLQSRVENITEHKAQQRVIGIDHYEVGAELSRRWRLPDIVVATLEFHDSPTDAGEFIIEAALVFLANQLSRIDSENPNELKGFIEQSEDLWAIAGMGPTALTETLAEVESALVEVFKSFYQG